MSMRGKRHLVLAASALWLFVPWSLPGQKKPLPTFRITGMVVNSRDNSPVRRCSLRASPIGGGRVDAREPVVATTDEGGHFSLNVPSAGEWELFASAPHIRSQPLDNHEGYFTGIILTSQSPTYDVVFHAVPDALLTGSVSDEAGEAVRNAQVTLYSMNADASQTGGSALQQHGSAQTDDRGRFEVAGLDPGGYMVQVQARPWYASGVQGRGPTSSAGAMDPSLDLVYPATWFPGVTDVSAAGVLTAHPGDVLQADFHLMAQPAAHLLVAGPGLPAPPLSGRPGIQNGGVIGQGGVQNPNVLLVLPDGGLQQVFGQITRTANGDLDVSGLAPGNYQVSFPSGGPGGGPGTASRTTMVRVQSGSSVALSAAPPETSVTVAVDGGTSVAPTQIVLVDRATGQSFSSFERGGGGRVPGPGPVPGPQAGGASGPRGGSRGRPGGGQSGGPGPRGRSRASGEGEEVTFQVPPGQYDVTVQGVSSAFVTGITATKGAVAVGRSVTIPEGAVRLAVHLASGFATVSGIASFSGKVSVGAMVLLVPATLGDPASLTVVRRDQTNSDGSFRLDSVIPGQYILVAIDQGWGVRWEEPATLRPYLLQGMPLELRSAAVVNSKIVAVSP